MWTSTNAFLRRRQALALLVLLAGPARAEGMDMLLDDFERRDRVSVLGTTWRGVSDRVMGGVSREALEHVRAGGHAGLRLTGDVRLENNGGFIQMALDLDARGGTLDASAFGGIELLVRGNGERYSVHLRTPDVQRPWQSYRAEFVAPAQWETVRLPFDRFVPYRLETPLDTGRLRRLGIVAIGRAFEADVTVAEIGLYR